MNKNNTMLKLIAVIVIAVILIGCLIYFANRNSSENELWDSVPMVMYEDSLYKSDQCEIVNLDYEFAGKVESCISYGTPTKNNQANDDIVGCGIYISKNAPNYIFVLYDGYYMPYSLF